MTPETRLDRRLCMLVGHFLSQGREAQAATLSEAVDELDRLGKLEAVVARVLAQRADDVCWRDVYEEMADLVGVTFDPRLLPKEQFLRNCAHFHDCLASGEPYVAPADPDGDLPEAVMFLRAARRKIHDWCPGTLVDQVDALLARHPAPEEGPR